MIWFKFRLSYCPSEPRLSSNTNLLSQQPPCIQISVLIGGTEGFYILVKEILKLHTNNTVFFPSDGYDDDVVNNQTNYQFTLESYIS